MPGPSLITSPLEIASLFTLTLLTLQERGNQDDNDLPLGLLHKHLLL